VANLVGNPGIRGDRRGPKFSQYQQVAESTGFRVPPFPPHLSYRIQSLSRCWPFLLPELQPDFPAPGSAARITVAGCRERTCAAHDRHRTRSCTDDAPAGLGRSSRGGAPRSGKAPRTHGGFRPQQKFRVDVCGTWRLSGCADGHSTSGCCHMTISLFVDGSAWLRGRS
jgi:hypothetical protein